MSLSRIFITLLLTGVLSGNVYAQSLLNRSVTVDVKRKPLSEVLNLISQQGNFYFSYISNILPQDSLVSLSVKNMSVRQALDVLFGGEYMYKESGTYIILFKKTPGQNFYQISGVVTDKKTGQRVPNASVYERQQLISTLTNNDGYFRLRLRDRYPTAAISVSKELYTDTSLLVSTGQDQEVTVAISPTSYQLKTVEITGHMQVEKTWFGRMLLSSRQKVQSMNLGAFLADKPYQASLTPGLGTHGKMGAQVINKFSFNMIGGYTAGVDGLEIGTLFNIVKGNMQHVQIAGGINVVGGKTNGVQLAGLHNNVLDSVKGLQIAGASNITQGDLEGVQLSGVIGQVRGNMNGAQVQGVIGITKGNSEGWQVAGIGNINGKDMEGAQLSGIFNHTKGSMRGAQIGMIGNIGKGTVNGVQIGTIFNYARKLNGVQIGLVNISDTSNGYSIGLVNIVKNGYHKVSLFSSDLLAFNAAWKTGRKELYSILLFGMNTGGAKAYSIGYGIGKEIPFNKHLFLAAEITGQGVFLGAEDKNLQVYRIQPLLNIKLANKISLFAGPSLAFSIADKGLVPKPGYLSVFPPAHYPSFKLDESSSGWLGWQAGISIF